MKKILSVFIVVLLILSTLSYAFAQEYSGTTTDYRYEGKFNAAKLFYNDFSVITDDHIAIPGLENTDVSGDYCSCMTPQGLCVTDKFIFVSAYCSVKKYKTELEENINYGNNSEKAELEKDHETHNSVIYIIDRVSGEYIKNIVLPDKNHVGGLATDGKNIFVAKSTDKQISVITAKQISNILATKSRSVKGTYDYTVDCGETASFVMYFKDIVWVGVFNEKEDGKLIGFDVDKKKFTLDKITEISIPAKANGGSFTEINGEICLNINSSYGRKNLSDIYLYSVNNFGAEEMSLELKDSFKAPPTVQNSDIYDGRVYFIYESAATCYSQVDSPFDEKATTCAIDRICIGEADRLFNWHSDENMLILKITVLINSFFSFVKSMF